MSVALLLAAASFPVACAAVFARVAQAVDCARRRAAQRRLVASVFGDPLTKLPSGPCPDVTLVGVLQTSDASRHYLATFFPRGALRLEPEDALALARPSPHVGDWVVALNEHVTVRLSEPTVVLSGSTNASIDMEGASGLRGVNLPAPPADLKKRCLLRAVKHGERVRVRGALEVEAGSTEGSFREPSQGWRLGARPLRPDRGAGVIVATEEPPRSSPRMRWAGAAAGAVLALGVLAAVGLVRARRSGPGLVGSQAGASGAPARCSQAVAEALARSDPWTALELLETCDAPLQRAEARWLTGAFEEASNAFADARARDGAIPYSVTEIESYLFAGHLDRAEGALTGLLARTGTGYAKAVDEGSLRCLSDTLNFRLRPDLFPYRVDLAKSSSLCQVLWADASRAAAAPVALTPEILRLVENRQGLTAPRRLVEAFATEQSVSEASTDWSGSPLWANFRTDVGNEPGESPQRYLRFRPLAIYGNIANKLRVHSSNSERARDLAVDLSLDDALADAVAGERSLASMKLGLAREYLERSVDPTHAESRIVTRSHLMLASWTAFYAGDDDGALRFASSHDDTYGRGRIRHAIRFRKGEEGPDYDEQHLASPNKEIFSLGLAGDGAALARVLGARHEAAPDVLFRVLPRLTRGQDEMRAWAKGGYPPPRCWTCGITPLFEYLADRRRLARGLSMHDLDDRLRAVLRSVRVVMSRRDVALMWLTLEIAHNEPGGESSR